MFVVNTLLVSRVLALLQGKSLSQTCGQWYLWSFPYYLVGAAVAGLMTATASRTDWLSALPNPVTNDTGLRLLPQPSGPSGSVTVFRSLTKFKAKARASLSKRVGVKRVRPVRIAYLEEENDMKHLIVEWQRLSGFESIACRVLILVTGAA